MSISLLFLIQGLLNLVSFFIGGFLIAVISPGQRIHEPAAGAFLSDRALYVAATIKMIQNVLIGVIAFGVAVYWSA